VPSMIVRGGESVRYVLSSLISHITLFEDFLYEVRVSGYLHSDSRVEHGLLPHVSRLTCVTRMNK